MLRRRNRGNGIAPAQLAIQMEKDDSVPKHDPVLDVLAYAPKWLEFQRTYMPYIGAQVAVRRDGELLFNQAFGYADLHARTPLTVDHLFRIASHSKTFTAVACMQLAEQGKLRLDDTAETYVEELKGAPMGGVTIRALLGHLSGMTRDGDDCGFWSLEFPFPDRQELLTEIQNHGKVLEPLEHFKYSNIGYSLLGLIIEGASGTSYRDYVTESIVDALGLKNTGPDLDFDRLDANHYAKGYTSRIHGPEQIEIEHIDTYAESAATGFYSTAAELTDYFQAHRDGDDRILTDGSKRQMRQVQCQVTDDGAYGLGLIISKIGGRTYYGHSGGYPGHITVSHLDLERQLSISVLTNEGNGPASTLATGILNLISLAADDKHKAKTEPRPAEELKRFEGRYAVLWGLTDIVNLGGRLYLLSPSAADPSAMATEVEVVSDTELKVVGDEGWGGYGEVMRYTFSADGQVEKIRGGSGMTMVPVEKFVLPKKLKRPTR